MRFLSFNQAIAFAQAQLRNGEVVHTERWQGIDITKKPEAAMHEARYVNFSVPMMAEDLTYYQNGIRPNLPWADDHFEERVGGAPLNPGVQWRKWPYAQSANNFREQGRFNHSYMERMWPKYAKANSPSFATVDDYESWFGKAIRDEAVTVNRGIKYAYGDLNDLVMQLLKEPLTRQAYLPIWFPEDTGVANPDRKPCTLGYLFLMRNGQLDVTYYIRSCDFVRHFRDDIYLTVRLLLWILTELRRYDRPTWQNVRPGLFRMDIGSLHCFRNDYIQLFGVR